MICYVSNCHPIKMVITGNTDIFGEKKLGKYLQHNVFPQSKIITK